MSDYLLGLIGVLIFFAGAGVVLLFREQKKLKQDYRLLAERLRRNNEDVAGLCSAAVEIDHHLASYDARLNHIIEMVNAYQPLHNSSVDEYDADDADNEQQHDYYAAIQKIRGGAGVQELVEQCGLTMDEAVLLSRLHGGNR